jgi:hypothetical protein
VDERTRWQILKDILNFTIDFRSVSLQQFNSFNRVGNLIGVAGSSQGAVCTNRLGVIIKLFELFEGLFRVAVLN